jgi:hypothetical protein
MRILFAIILYSVLFIIGCAETTDKTTTGNFNPHGGLIRMPTEEEKKPDKSPRNIKRDFDKLDHLRDKT